MRAVVSIGIASCVASLSALLVSSSGGAMAAEIIPPDRRTDWTPGVTVGVPGGIPTDRARRMDVTKAPYHADNTGVTDSQPTIQKAIADAQENDVIYLPAGTYRIDKTVAVAGGKSRVTIRGAGPDKTVIMACNQSHLAICPADGGDWWYPNGGIGQICQLSLKNDRQLPVVAPAHWEYMRRQLSRIVAKTATTVTISPGLLYDLPAELAPVLRPVGRYSERVGIEDLTVDGTNSTASRGLILINASHACWVKNVTMRKAERYVFVIDGALQCEVRHCSIGHRKSAAGPNGGGLLMGVSSFCLVEDNIVRDTFPDMEIDGSSGNVFAYNFCDDKLVEREDRPAQQGKSLGRLGEDACERIWEGTGAKRLPGIGPRCQGNNALESQL